MSNNFPKLHNAAWPGVVGKGEGSEPPIGLDTMLDLTAAAEVNGQRFDGVDLFLFDPHVSIDSTDKQLEELAKKVRSHGLVVGSVVAPVWPPTGGGSAMGDDAAREQFLTQVRKGCRIARTLKQLGIRPYGVVRIDSACSPTEWARQPEGQHAADRRHVSQGVRHRRGIRRTARGRGRNLLGRHAQHAAHGRAAGGRQPPEDARLSGRHGPHAALHDGPQRAGRPARAADFRWDDTAAFDAGYKQLTDALRPWTIDFHVAQNNGEVFGSGSHDKTGRHCLPNAPDGKLDIVKYAGYWLRDERGTADASASSHICWDGCMFPNETLHETAHVERHPGGDGRRPRRAWLE